MPEIVQEIGAYAGLASVVGLAVLSALYFSQARDVKRLREWAGRAPERAEGEAPPVPGRVTAQPARSPTQPPVPGAPPTAARPAATPAAAAAAGARPATAPVPPGRAGAATPAARPGQAVPAPSGGASGSGAGPGTAVPVPAAASAGSVAPAKPAGPGVNTGAQTEGREAAPPQTPQPGTPVPEAAPANAGAVKDGSAAADATKEDATREGAPKEGAPKEDAPKEGVTKEGTANAGPTVSRPAPSPPVPRPARAAAPTAAGRPGGPTRPATGQPTTVIPPPRRQPWYRSVLSNPLYAVLAVAGVLIVGGAAAFGITQLVSDEGTDSSGGERAGAAGGDDTQDNGAAADNDGDQPRRAVRPANVTVAVLNGTTVPGLAATLADQVTSAGFSAGTVANFTNNQQLAESVVQYASGHEREAAAVGRRLGIDQRETATAASQELAGDATVIVIAGGDKAP